MKFAASLGRRVVQAAAGSVEFFKKESGSQTIAAPLAWKASTILSRPHSSLAFDLDTSFKDLAATDAATELALLRQQTKEEVEKAGDLPDVEAEATMEIRDYIQSSQEGLPPMGPGSDVIKYISLMNDMYQAGAPIKSVVAFGGTWWQLLAMHDINPFDHFRNVLAATPVKPGQKALPIECLQRACHLFGLEEVSQDVIRETYRKLAEIAGPDRPIIIRLFQFNNVDMQKDSTYAAIKELREQGIGNFTISDEHSYAPFMSNKEVAAGVVRGLLRNIEMTAGDTSYPIQGGIKDFSGSLAPQDAEMILRYTDIMIRAAAKGLEAAGNLVDATRLREATLTLHSHLTDRSKDTADIFENVGKELKRKVTTHRIHEVENATHHVMGSEGLNEEQLKLHLQAEEVIQKIRRDNDKAVVKDFKPGAPREWTGFAGGGTPMIEKYIKNISMMEKRPEAEVRVEFYKEMATVRDRNKIPPVTPAQKAIADLAFMRMQNRKAGKLPYHGSFTSEVVDVVRNLDPKKAQDKDLLEGAYHQYRQTVLGRYKKEGKVSAELKAELLKVSMNSDWSSLDKEKTEEVLKAFRVPADIQEEIIEACGRATRPTRFPDQMEIARKKVTELKAKGSLKIAEDEAVLLGASLAGRNIGLTVVEHHGDKSKFPDLAHLLPKTNVTGKPSILTDMLYTGLNLAGHVMHEVMGGAADNDSHAAAVKAEKDTSKQAGGAGR